MPLPSVVSYTIQAVTAADCQSILIVRRPDNGLKAIGTFALEDEGGNTVGTGTTSIDLSAGQTTSINSFVTSALVPAMNAQ